MENTPCPPINIYSKEKIRNNNTNNGNELINSMNKPLVNKDNNIDASLLYKENEIIKESDIINIIKQKFNENIYFTKINRNLAYLNPFCNEDDIFGEDIKFLYRTLNENENENKNNNEFHLFKTINEIISELKKNKFNKCSFLFLGDSCSGKSKIINESINYLINYFNSDENNLTETNDNINYINNIIIENNFNSSISNKNYRAMTSEEGVYSLDNNKYNLIYITKRISAGLSILKAFGNAKTEKNNNSTRTINYIKIRMNKNCNKIIGMELLPFLFDKNRVGNLEENQGYNFNIFYYLLNCDDNDLISKLFLSNDNGTNTNYSSKRKDISYQNEFNEIKGALNVIGFNNDEILTIFKIISSIILLGNIKLNTENKFKSSLNRNEILLKVCELLNIDINEFVSALVNQETFNMSININDEIEEIEQTKNNFMNELYNQMFLWIINKINNNINNIIPENDKEKSIIFLDFPGYEDNTNNYLEQLFINYMNELVYYFYSKDLKDLNADINGINNNKDILNTINYLFEEMKNFRNEKQMKLFISNFIKDIQLEDNNKRKFTKIKNKISLINNSNKGNCFIIKHSIGDIYYDIKNTLNKNMKNFLPWNLLDCILKSKDSNIRNIYKNNRKNILTSNNNSTSENKINFNYYEFNYGNIFNNSFITFSEEYMNYIKEIKQEIKQSKRRYLICIKSNPNNVPLKFEQDYISKKIIFYKIQLNITNTININDDFIKIKFDEFVNNYDIIIKKYISDFNCDKQNKLFNAMNQVINNNIKIEENFKFDKNGNILTTNQILNFLDEEKRKIKEENDKKILVIQAGIKSFIEKNKIKNHNQIYFFLQNFLRILIAKRKLNKIQELKQLLLIQLNLFVNKIKNKANYKNENKSNKSENINLLIDNDNNKLLEEEEKNQENENKKSYMMINENDNNNSIIKEKTKKIEKRISMLNSSNEKSNKFKEKINQLDSNKMKLKSKEKINIDKTLYQPGIKIFQEKIFLNKIELKKKSTKKIINFGFTLLTSRYYIIMKKEIKVIQKYLNPYIQKQKLLENAINIYIKKKNEKIKNNLIEKINKILFPCRTQKMDDNEQREILNKQSNNRDNNENSDFNKQKVKYNMSTSERYKEYKRKNQFFNIFNQNNLLKDDKITQKEKTHNPNETKEINKNSLIKNIPNLSNIDYSTTYLNQDINKIFILSKIIDIDILSDIFNEDIYDELQWIEEYKKIYEFNLKNKTPIEQIYLSDTHTLLINNIGNIFLFGMNNKGQCGLNNKNSKSYYISAKDFLKNYQNFDNEFYWNIKEAILKDGTTLMLNKQGKIFNFNYNDIMNNNPGYLNTSTYNNDNNSPINTQIIQASIQSIKTTGNMNLYLSKSNEVYIDIPNKNNFLKLFLPNKIKICSISCGYNFYILLSSFGKLYSGGSNIYGELCDNSNIKQRISPEEIYAVSNLNESIIQVSCGFKHVIILSEKQSVYGWGNNTFGQLFSEKKRKTDLIKLNCDKKIIQITAGFRSTFLLDEKNDIYFFGILNNKIKNTETNMERLLIEEKNYEYGNKNEFIPVKINAKWNKLFSIFYVNFADIRNISVKIEDKNRKFRLKKIKYIINAISSSWLINSLKIPFIKEISQYFTDDYMEKSDKTQQEIFY